MDFTLTEEQIMIRDAARDFARNELLPGVIERDEKQEFPHEQIKKMGELGSIPLFSLKSDAHPFLYWTKGFGEFPSLVLYMEMVANN